MLMLTSLILFALFANATGVPPIVVNVVTLAVGTVLAVVLKISPIPSKYVAWIAVAVGFITVAEPIAIKILPPSVDAIVFSIAFVLTSISERVQGGVTDPSLRAQTVVDEKQAAVAKP
jgi:hypothetical protein